MAGIYQSPPLCVVVALLYQIHRCGFASINTAAECSLMKSEPSRRLISALVYATTSGIFRYCLETGAAQASNREPLPLLWAEVFEYPMEISQPLSLSFSDVQISIDNYYCYHQEAPQCWTNLSAF